MAANADHQPVDRQKEHQYYSVQCFNDAWALIDKPERTPEDEEEMLRLAMTSHWHWTQRKDVQPHNASIAHWQVSRVFALLGQPDLARRFGARSLAVFEGAAAPPFLRGYAHEALARAAGLAGDAAAMDHHLAEARRLAEDIEKGDSRDLLLDDLATIALAE